MSSRKSPRSALVRDTVRAHRRAAAAWVVGWTTAMVVIALGYVTEVRRVEGGAAAMAASIEAGARALRLLRWPAERLDTLGGYLTYHNVTLFAFFLCVYAGIQGVGALRGAEAGGLLDLVVATGRPRRAVLVDRALGFALTLALVGVGFAAGLALATALAVVLAALLAYALGVVVSQVMGTARAGSAVTALVLTVLYLLTNVADEVGALGLARFMSPTYWFGRSRALVPGQGLDLVAVSATVALTVALLAIGAWALERRDLGAPLHRRAAAVRPPDRVQRPALGRLWTATLVRDRLGLLTWAVSTAAGMALLAWLEPTVRDLWDEMTFSETLFRSDPGVTVSDQYLSMSGEFLAPVIAAFAVTQAVAWTADREGGRVGLFLSTPLSWAGLVRERLVALLVGAGVITAAALAGLGAGAAAVGVTLSGPGLVRLAAAAMLLAVALGAVAAAVVAWLPSRAATLALTAFLGASYLLVLLTQLFGWPEGLTRLSVFGAFGHPYLEVPAVAGLAFLAVLAAAATLAAVVVGGRTAKVA